MTQIKKPAKRPVHRIGFEVHPFKLESEIRYICMDTNIHVGDLGAFSVFALTNNKKMKAFGEKVLRYVEEKFPNAEAMVYAAPSWPLYFSNCPMFKELETIENIYMHYNGSKTADTVIALTKMHENNKVKAHIKIIKREKRIVIPYRQILTHSLAVPVFEQIPAKQQVMYALTKAMLSSPFILEMLYNNDVEHVYKYGWLVKTEGRKIEIVAKPKLMIDASATVLKNISTFTAGGKSAELVAQRFPTNEEELVSFVEKNIKSKGGRKYFIITPLLLFPQEETIVVEESLPTIPKGRYAFHLRPLHDPYTFEVLGITMKLCAFNECSMNNSSKGVGTLAIIGDKAYTLIPEGMISKLQGEGTLSVELVELDLSMFKGLKEKVGKYMELMQSTASTMKSCLDYITSLFEQGVYEVYKEYKSLFTDESKSMLANNLKITRKSAEKLKDL